MGLFAAYVRRIRADRVIDSVRAGFLKGTLNRQLRFGIRHISQELPMSLDPLRPEPAYQMGRLFAALERNQSDSLGRDLNASIKDRYFGAASATPAAVFPRLIRLTQHHLSALEGGRRVNAEKRMQEIMARLDSFPPHLTLAEQGLFAIGYYHQVQAFFTPRETEAIADPA
jgi:CRISPR-associated protein Csd1